MIWLYLHVKKKKFTQHSFKQTLKLWGNYCISKKLMLVLTKDIHKLLTC